MRKTISVTLVSLFFCAGLIGSALCQEPAEAEKKKEPVVTSIVKEVQGEVSYITRRSISVVFAHDEQKGEDAEIMIPLDPGKTVVEHKKNLGEIQVGDKVSVKYVVENADYGNRKENKIQAKVITFTGPADQESRYKKAHEQEAVQQPPAQQPPAQQESLPLKGEKSND